MWYFLVSGNNKRKWPLALVGLLLLCSIKLVLCQDNSDAGATESNIEAQRREGNAQQSDNGKEIIMSSSRKTQVMSDLWEKIALTSSRQRVWSNCLILQH